MATKNDAPALMAIHPGIILKAELVERGISQKDFAHKIGMQASHLSEIIKGKRRINKQTADKLEEALGIPSIDWVNLQTRYDYDSRLQNGRQVSLVERAREERDMEIAVKMKQEGFAMDVISKITDLAPELVAGL
ncbi:MAG: HigA family addiction module antitoxin [Candidatus Cryptobacteroides sp.]